MTVRIGDQFRVSLDQRAGSGTELPAVAEARQVAGTGPQGRGGEQADARSCASAKASSNAFLPNQQQRP